MHNSIVITADEMSALVTKARSDRVLPLSYGSHVWLDLNDLPAAAWALRELMDMRGIKHDVDYSDLRQKLTDIIAPFLVDHYLRGMQKHIVEDDTGELVNYLMDLLVDEV